MFSKWTFMPLDFFFVNYVLRFVPSWISTQASLWPLPNDISIISFWGFNFQIISTLLIRPRRIPLMLFPLPPSFFIIQLCPQSSHLCKWYSMTLTSSQFFLLMLCRTLPWNLPFHVTLMSLPVCFSLSTEWYLVWAVLLCRIQGNEPHAVHRLWPSGPRKSIRYLAHHAEHDCRSYLLCCFYWPCNSSYPVPGLL